MASRRLAISSLLCDDDAAPTSSADSQLSPQSLQHVSNSPHHLLDSNLQHRRSSSPLRLTSPTRQLLGTESPTLYQGSRRDQDRISPFMYNARQHSNSPQNPYTHTQSHPTSPNTSTSPRQICSFSNQQQQASTSTSPYSSRSSQSDPPYLTSQPRRPSLSPTAVYFQQQPNVASVSHHSVRPNPAPIISSLSSTTTTSTPFSGLEALVQAATEERARITFSGDTHSLGDGRRRSGGSNYESNDERFPSPYAQSIGSLRGSASPNLIRSDVHLNKSPAISTLSLPYDRPRSLVAEDYVLQSAKPESSVRPEKRRRSMPESEPDVTHIRSTVVRSTVSVSPEQYRRQLSISEMVEYHSQPFPHSQKPRPHVHIPSVSPPHLTVARTRHAPSPSSPPLSPAKQKRAVTNETFSEVPLTQTMISISPSSSTFRTTVGVTMPTSTPLYAHTRSTPSSYFATIVNTTSPSSSRVVSPPGADVGAPIDRPISIGKAANPKRKPPRSDPSGDVKKSRQGEFEGREILHPVPKRAGNSMDLMVNLGPLKDYVKDEEAAKKVELPGAPVPHGQRWTLKDNREISPVAGQTMLSHGATMSPAAKEEEEDVRIRDERDAHDFFLEALEQPSHLENTPVSRPRPGSRVPKQPPQTVYAHVWPKDQKVRQPKQRSVAQMFSSSPVPATDPSHPVGTIQAHHPPARSEAAECDTGVGVAHEEHGVVATSHPGTPNQEAEVDVDAAILAATTDDELDIISPLAPEALANNTGGTEGDFDVDVNTMDVDVEDELLSLIDDQPRNHRPTDHHLHSTTRDVGRNKDSLGDTRQTIATFETAGKELESMPPSLSKNQKDRNKVTRPGSIEAIAKSSQKGRAGKDDRDKADKAKMASKPKAKPGTSSKSKAVKQSKERLTEHPPAPISSHPSLPAPFTTTPADPFPNVTSSGRMIHKTKKSVAAVTTAPRRGVGSGSASPFPVPAVPSIKENKRKSNIVAVSETRSRSQSVMPRDSLGPDGKVEHGADGGDAEVDEEDQDDKLYCVCKTRYDEDRVMIACDRCDEWYHTQCVNMPDLEVDLVDQFICPPCIARNPMLSLKTTYKPRCRNGLVHPDPGSADACHKPARGSFSKYCSDECGIRCMEMKIQSWASRGGDVAGLWGAVKGSKRREGVVVCERELHVPEAIATETKHEEPRPANMSEISTSNDELNGSHSNLDAVVRREVDRLHALLRAISRDREQKKKELEVAQWRERLLDLATERAARIDKCGWDQRLCFGDEECAEFGEAVLESYEEHLEAGRVETQEDDEYILTHDGEWWCQGRKKCERHTGWQKLRGAEVTFEKDMNEAALAKLTTREREIRKNIEDMLDPQSQQSHLKYTSKAPLKSHMTAAQRKTTDGAAKKGKKKNPGRTKLSV